MIRLKERGKYVSHNLSKDDIVFLLKKHDKHLDVKLDKIKAGIYIGSVTCPSGEKIIIEPKVPVENLLYIISYTYDVVKFYNYDDFRAKTRVKSPIAIYIRVLLNWVDLLFKKGLLKSYTVKKEHTSNVRGKIVDTRNFRVTGKVFCENEEISFSCPENQVLKSVLVYILMKIDLSELTDLKVGIEQYLRLLNGVELIKLSPKVFSSIKYNRLNKSYKRIIDLCQLIYNGTYLCDLEGGVIFSGYLINMQYVFEKFVYKIFDNRFKELGVKFQHKREEYLIENTDDLGVIAKIDAIMDILIPGKLVIDAKYYSDKQIGSHGVNKHNLDQIHLYCLRERVNGLLVYPGSQVVSKPYITNSQVNENITLVICKFPLNSKLEEFEKNIDEFLEKMSFWFTI